MDYTRTINICNPGYNASCALCCGSHNYQASHEGISELFEKRSESISRYINRDSQSNDLTEHDYTALHHIVSEFSMMKAIDDAIQCPFVGYVETSTIGCLIYPDNDHVDLRLQCLTGGTCKHFSCAAREVLTDDEIEFAAKLMGDWYHYSLMINDITFLKKIYLKYETAEKVPFDVLNGIKKELTDSLFEHSLINK